MERSELNRYGSKGKPDHQGKVVELLKIHEGIPSAKACGSKVLRKDIVGESSIP